jgi:hypothetical protein
MARGAWSTSRRDITGIMAGAFITGTTGIAATGAKAPRFDRIEPAGRTPAGSIFSPDAGNEFANGRRNSKRY